MCKLPKQSWLEPRRDPTSSNWKAFNFTYAQGNNSDTNAEMPGQLPPGTAQQDHLNEIHKSGQGRLSCARENLYCMLRRTIPTTGHISSETFGSAVAGCARTAHVSSFCNELTLAVHRSGRLI